MDARITIVARLNAHTGYGLHLIHLVRGLKKRGYFPSVRGIDHRESFAELPADVRQHVVHTQQPEELEILLTPPFVEPTPGKRTIYITMCESDRIPPKAVENVNKAETILVPSSFCYEAFKASGVNEDKLAIAPLGIDPKLFHPVNPKLGPDKIVRFCAAGRTAHGRRRKGLDAVITAFQETEITNIRLDIKVQPDCQLPRIFDDRITVQRGHWTDFAVATWLKSHHAFISASAGEGWGLWQQQAAACGLAVLSPRWGGVIEFLDDNSPWVSSLEVEAKKDGWCGNWVRPNEYALREQIEDVTVSILRNHDTKAFQSPRAASLTWDNHAGHVDNAIRCLTDKPVTQIHATGNAFQVSSRTAARSPGSERKVWRFYHGLGDCANAAIMLGAVENRSNVAIECSHFMAPIFNAAGVETFECGTEDHPYLHPAYGRPGPSWMDNKAAFNCPIPMTDEIWSKMKSLDVSYLGPDEERDIILIHTKGRTSGKWKDMPLDVAQELVWTLNNSGHRAVVLGDREYWMPNDCANSKPNLDGLLILMRRTKLLIGIDSGPLHLARFTNTPAIGCWFGMHPTAFSIPHRDHVHVLPRLWYANNEYGSIDHWNRMTSERSREWNLDPVEKVTAKEIIKHVTSKI